MDKSKRKQLKVTITKVEKNIENRRTWGRWLQIREAVLNLGENETIKIGPFADEKLAYLCRNNAVSGGVREQIKAKGFIAITEITIENKQAYCYVQKIKRLSGNA